jgi:hypothetical protein
MLILRESGYYREIPSWHERMLPLNSTREQITVVQARITGVFLRV